MSNSKRTDARALPGEGVDWSELYVRYGPDLRRLIARRVPSSAMVEDILQETFVQALRSRHLFDPTRPAWPWLATLAHRSCVKSWRAETRSKVSDSASPTTSASGSVGPGCDDHVTRLEHARAISEAFAQLAPRHRRVLYLRDIEGVSCDRLAEQESVSYQAVKSLLGRARADFRRRYTALHDASWLITLVHGALVRTRLRTLTRLAPTYEKAGALAGTLLIAGLLGMTVAPPSVPSTNRGLASTAHKESSNHPVTALRFPPPGESTDPKQYDNAADNMRALNGSTPSGATSDPARSVPLGVSARGTFTNNDNSSWANLWVDVTDPSGHLTATAGHEVRCDSGRVAEVQCAALRLAGTAGP